MEDIGRIPEEIVRKIAIEHLENLDDFESFKEVCSNWRFAIKEVDFVFPSTNTQLPWLMLADSPTTPYRRFHSLTKSMFRKFDLPERDDDDDDHRRYFSSMGCVISASRRNRNINLFDPFSGRCIKLPSVKLDLLNDIDEFNPWNDNTYRVSFIKFILSARPSESASYDDELEIAMVYDKTQRLAFWRSGQPNWMKPDVDLPWVFDLCFFKGQFYSVDHQAKVMAFGSDVTKKQPRLVANLMTQGLILENPMNMYIVPIENKLVLIERSFKDLDEEPGFDENSVYTYATQTFDVFELDLDDGKVKRVESIGNRAIFVGHGSTFLVEADNDEVQLQTSSSSSNKHKCGCKSNCIYFTDDWYETYYVHKKGGGGDMGIYSLAQRKVVDTFYQGPSQFDFVNPPIWVELPRR
ncbi:hypothetical protein SOVF_037360 [Spinacia oleracea]|uniref:KIB1-4 beta-propeller domain-containing protein n=1 Tax=Spinacia oleracea TaxID=3562 RepID=A0A9R0K9A1_SPIOL|nr:uncharacterized protein LOC110802110 [Spinacia oleracea]KNA22064.1 hypothetical protein SOVF_037360 [Spinacia oleracea]